MKDIISELGALAMGSRLKRMSDTVMRGGAEIYRSNNIDFEPKWFPLFYLLSKEERELGIMEIAEKLNISHPAVIQLAKELEKQGWILSKKSKKDARKRFLQLTPKGRDFLPQLQAIWTDIRALNEQIINSQATNLLRALEEIEQVYAAKSYAERMNDFQKSKTKQ
jgi:DNA-binding MarR family transcriptional regulator